MAGSIATLVVVAVLFAAAYVAMAQWESSRYQEQRGITSADFYKQTEIAIDGDVYDLKKDLKAVLVMGVDHPTPSEECAEMLMLLVLDHEDKLIRWLHINRDTLVTSDTGTANTLDAAMSMAEDSKARNLERVDQVGQLLGGVEIGYYITLDFSRVGELNDRIGGIAVTVQDDFSAYDPAMVPGASLTLSAEQISLFLNDEIAVGDGSELSRMNRQREFVLSLFNRLRTLIRDDSDTVMGILDEMDGIMFTNFYTAQMLNEFARAYSYGVPDVELLQGVYVTDDGGNEYFQADATAARTWALDAFYNVQ